MADYRNWLSRCVYHSRQGEPVLYQGIGPCGTALIFYGNAGIEEDRLAACFARNGGRYGQRVDWLFQKRGQLLISKWHSGVDENTLVLEGLGAGADDVRFDDGDVVEILTKTVRLQSIADIFELEEIPVLQQGVIHYPANQVLVDRREDITNLIGLLEEVTAMEDIWNVVGDFWMIDEQLEAALD